MYPAFFIEGSRLAHIASFYSDRRADSSSRYPSHPHRDCAPSSHENANRGTYPANAYPASHADGYFCLRRGGDGSLDTADLGLRFAIGQPKLDAEHLSP